MFNDAGYKHRYRNLEKEILDIRMDSLEQRLTHVFKENKVDQNIQQQIAEVVDFFRKRPSLIEEYKAFITLLESIQIAENQPEAVAIALIKLNQQIPDRQQHLRLLNIGTIIGLVALTLVGLAAIAGAILVGLTVSVFDPMMGISHAIALSMCGVAALVMAGCTLGSITPSRELDNEINREKNLLSFFATKNSDQNTEQEPIVDNQSLEHVAF
ncbi:hypothetical protein [Legionella waltersii]|uniref:DUF5638 domain-containing protein n=1 Tax=Legionella waltersii TaxID=66969 RepID=A0A0W1ANZ5_9GAMM|nr:hypothetical protein [Legionella waltersii]KTD83065.1 hypothetical protein Lwal_0053 [Legionella waltersii]SNV08186.1 Uncharacterised protein [Legionella waltersii]